MSVLFYKMKRVFVGSYLKPETAHDTSPLFSRNRSSGPRPNRPRPINKASWVVSTSPEERRANHNPHSPKTLLLPLRSCLVEITSPPPLSRSPGGASEERQQPCRSACWTLTPRCSTSRQRCTWTSTPPRASRTCSRPTSAPRAPSRCNLPVPPLPSSRAAPARVAL